VHLDEIIEWIDRAFGEEQLLSQSPELSEEIDALREAIGGDGYQRYLRDQINRQIIRDYLTNAVVLGVITESGLATFSDSISSEEGRATLALYMLMSAVEDAAHLPPVSGEMAALKPLDPAAVDRSHIKLVPP